MTIYTWDPQNFLIRMIRYNHLLRRKLAKVSYPLFFLIYLGDSMTHQTAAFQKEMFSLLEDGYSGLDLIIGFRGCSKSLICNTGFALYSVISGKAHNVVICSETIPQAREHLANVKRICEANSLLRNDFGKLESDEQWGLSALVFKDFNAKISITSLEQAVRGSRYKHFRPDLLIIDDLESWGSTRTKESRTKIYNLFVSELIALGTPNTKIIVLGNFLHESSLTGRLMTEIKNGKRSGRLHRYPLVNDHGQCLWPERFPDVAAYKLQFGDEVIWQREMLLKIIAAEDGLIAFSELRFYDEMPPKDEQHGYLFTIYGADFAISPDGDLTAIVGIQVHRRNSKFLAYVLPNPINHHLDFKQAIEAMKEILKASDEPSKTKIAAESNGFQDIYYQHMLDIDYHQVIPIRVSGDKFSRFKPAAAMMKSASILWPRTGAQDAIDQWTGFPGETYDDCCDALSLAIRQALEEFEKSRSLWTYLDWVERNHGPFIGRPIPNRFSRLISDDAGRNRLTG